MDTLTALKLITVANEMYKRYQEKLEKEAQYQSVAEQLAPRIVNKLVQNGIVNSSDATDLQDVLVKSGSAAIELLDNVVSTVDAFNVHSAATPAYTMGRPHQTTPYKYEDIDHTLIDGFVVDINKLR